MSDISKKLLEDIWYTSRGYLDSTDIGNHGDAKEWLRHLRRALENYEEQVLWPTSNEINEVKVDG